MPEATRSRLHATRQTLVDHWVFATLFAAGLVLRILVEIAFHYPFVQPDSHRYLKSAIQLKPDFNRPSGYSLLLHLVPGWRSLWPVTYWQHALGLLIGVLLYWMLVRRGAPRWAAALATVPVLLDPFQLALEHYIMSDVAFEAFMAGAFVLLSFRRRISWQIALVAGVLLGCATVTRAVGDVLAAVAAVMLLLGQARWRPAIAVLVGTALPIVAYMGWYHSDYGTYSTGRFPDNVLYQRVVEFADCTHVQLPSYERNLCPRVPKSQLQSAYFYSWSKFSPARNIHPPAGMTSWQVLHDFNRRVIRQQPLRFAHLIVTDGLRAFMPDRHGQSDGSGQTAHWRFTRFGHDPPKANVPGMPPADQQHIKTRLARGLTLYSDIYVPGPVFLVLLLISLVAAAGFGRARRSGLRSTTALFGLSWVVMLFGSVAVSIFSWRYMLPQFVLVPPAGLLGILALWRREPDPDALTGGQTLRTLLYSVPGLRRLSGPRAAADSDVPGPPPAGPAEPARSRSAQTTDS